MTRGWSSSRSVMASIFPHPIMSATSSIRTPADPEVVSLGAGHSPLFALVTDKLRERILNGEYAPGERLRLQAYRAIAAANSAEDVTAVREELVDRYGPLPEPVENLLLVAGLRMLARKVGVTDITLQGSNVRFGPVDLRESQELRLSRLHPRAVLKPATHQVLVPRPSTARIGGKPVVGRELLQWTADFLTTILDT